MQVLSLSSAAHTALNGLGQVVRQVEEVAEKVAAGRVDEPGTSFAGNLDDIARLSELRLQARADAEVFSTVEQLFAELSSMPRL